MAPLASPDVVLRRIADAAADLGFGAGALRVVDGDDLVIAERWGDGDRLSPRVGIGRGLSGRVPAANPVLILEDPAREPGPDALAEEADRGLGDRRFVGAPLRVASRLLGVLVLLPPASRRLTADETATLATFAGQAAIALDNARRHEAAQRQRQQAEALTEIARDISADLERNAVLQRVVEHARRLCRADLVALALCGPDGAATVVAKAGHWSEVHDRVYHAGVGLGGEALATRALVTTADLLGDPRWRPDERARVESIRAAAAVPILAGDALLGLLWVHRRTAEPFTESEVATVEALARHAAVAIQNAALYETARTGAAEVQALRRIGLDLSRSLELPRLLQGIVEAAREGTGSDAAFCAVVDPATLDAETLASSGARSAAFARYRIQPGLGIGGWFLVHKRPFRTEDYLSDPRFIHGFDDAARAEGIASNLGVPILHDDQVIGVLWVFNRTRRPFTERDETFLAGLGDHAAAAIVNARVYAERERALEELRTSQSRLVQAERLRALGEMASGVAHDFNNLIAVILGRAQLLQMRVSDTEVRRSLAMIERAATDAAHTVRRIQEFTRTRQTRAVGPVDLARVIADAVELTRGRWKDEGQVRGVTYRVTTEFAPVPPVAGEASDLREVFMNLILNALDAMPEGGEVRLAVAGADDTVVTAVTDTGHGMPRETRERVFEPFFTTKGPRSTGLGLSVVYGIVQRYGGRIEVDSVEGRGATFTVILPAWGAGMGAARAAEPPPLAPTAAPARVLVIDDEAPVRDLLADILRAAGHVPLVAEDGPAALARLERGEAADVALIDLGLPGMSGWEVAARLRTTRPELPLVLVTGWGDRLDPGELERRGIAEVIAKPFQAADILRVVATRRGPRPA